MRKAFDYLVKTSWGKKKSIPERLRSMATLLDDEFIRRGCEVPSPRRRRRHRLINNSNNNNRGNVKECEVASWCRRPVLPPVGKSVTLHQSKYTMQNLCISLRALYCSVFMILLSNILLHQDTFLYFIF